MTQTNTWDQVLQELESKVNPHTFRTWFRPTRFHSETDGIVHVAVPNDWFAEWLRTNYLVLIRETLRAMNRSDLDVLFRSEDTVAPPPKMPTTAIPAGPSGPPPVNGSRNGGLWFQPRYTFDTFVVSSCNQFAHAAAMAVAEQPSRAYNPLYIYGGVGLGKTHLMQAIGNHLSRRRDLRMAYLSTEHFVSELISAMRFNKTYEFKEKYRNIDLLLIDDVQFLAGKDRTQEEFFHTFNTLYEADKQIVLTSDVPPREIPTLEERLRSRFEWGLIADIQPPDLETKIAILRKKAEAEGTRLPDDVALLIASNSRSNVRELEGALTRLTAYCSMTGRNLDLEVAGEVLKNFLVPTAPAATVEAIQKLVASHYKLKASDLKAKNNSQQIAMPRQVAMYLCKKHTNCSLAEIGRRFGGKHHATVLHAIRKIRDLRKSDPDFDRTVESLSSQLR